MNTRGRYPWVIGALFVALSGCAGAAAPSRGAIPPIDGNGSWMAPAAKAQNLLYVSDEATNAVDVFTYPGGEPAGVLRRMHDPEGLCADKAGDVWVVNAPVRVLEYAHGAHDPEATLEDDAAFSLSSCAVNPVNGDLAVVDAGRAAEPGSVEIFRGATGKPHRYASHDLYHVLFCTYDARGNLFVDGLDAAYGFHLAELARGAKKLRDLGLNQTIGFPGAVAWDGKYLALGDRYYQGKNQAAIYQVSISGSQGTIVGTTVLDGSCDLLGFTAPKLGSGKGNPQATRLVAPDPCGNAVRFYSYPEGGAPIKDFGALQYPFGAAVSAVR